MDLHETFSQEWFANPDWWFSKKDEYDRYIIDKYSCLLEPHYISKAISPLQKIIIYDQLPRHIYRDHPSSSHIIEQYLTKAMDVVYEYLNTSYYKNLVGIEWTFFILPLRHTKVIHNILFVIKETWKKIENDKKNINIYKRFLKATYNKLLQDNKNQSKLINTILPKPSVDYYDIHLFSSILNFSPSSYKFPNNELLITPDIKFNKNIIDVDKPIIISLSGGVDSMVCSFIIKRFFPTANIIALHISYDNREECDKEILFLKHWCSHLNIVLHVRTINEIHRKPCMQYELRDLYESYTRDVRYNCYKSITNETIPQVIMGHNSDDMLENIMTNIAHKNKYDNLYGMSYVSLQDDIKFLRPLLDTPKDDIIDFALKNSIPYLPNSTPVWSQRGQIRNDIVPVLDKWNKNYIPSLFNLTDILSSLHRIMQFTVSHFINKGCFDDDKKVFTIKEIILDELIYEEVFWKEVFKTVYNVYPSSKSLDNFMFSYQKFMSCFDTIQKNETKKIMITKNHMFEIKKTSDVAVMIKILSE